MASHNLAIAKASFSAGLLRPDPTSVSRSSITDFHTLLTTLTLQCSPKNVQNCKRWILENIVQSTARCTSLGKYLMALTTSFAKDTAAKGREPSIKRRRLHILYLVNDLLHHAKYNSNDASVSSKLQPILPTLFGHAAAFKSCPNHNRKLRELLKLWQEKDYYSREYIDKLRETVHNALEAGEYSEGSNTLENNDSSQATKSTPYIMPATHGDTSTPWFDLPAGNLMLHIMPNSTRPINPDLIRPLQFVAGPADKNLALAVEALLEDVHAIFETRKDGEDEKREHDIDELGQPIILDEITGEVVDGEGYYGWSRGFCEKMKRRKLGLDPLQSDTQDRRSRSRSRSSSPGGRKRRYSSSSRSRSRSSDHHSRRRRCSYSSSGSRSPTPDRRTQNGQSHSHSRPQSRGHSSTHSNSPHPAPAQPFSSGSSQLPPRPPFQPPYPQQGYNSNFPPPPPPPGQPPPMPFDPQTQNQGYGRGAPSGWVPPPPQFQNPQFQQQYQNPQFPNMPFIPPNQQFGAWPPPPPPPPPGQPSFQQQGGWSAPGQGGPGRQQGNWQPPQGNGFQGQGGGFQQGQAEGGHPQGPGGWQQGQQGGGRGGWNGNNNNNNNFRGGRGGYRGRGW